MTFYPPAWPHGELKEIFTNLFFVMGTNITSYEGVELQHSRNMVVIKNDEELTIINTVRLSEDGLAALDKLGKVTHVIRIGAFHGRDDAFYLDRYSANLWALQGMVHENNRITDIELIPGDSLPFPNGSLFLFETSIHPEGILHLHQEGGILISCDSIKNWVTADPYFSEETAKLYESLGFFGEATISQIWQQACKVQIADFERLKQLNFKHLISAHGMPLMKKADDALKKTLKNEFNI